MKEQGPDDSLVTVEALRKQIQNLVGDVVLPECLDDAIGEMYVEQFAT